LVPTNLVSAAANDQMLSVIIGVVLFSLALRQLSPDQRDPFLRLARALSALCMVLVRWLLMLLPVGAFSLSIALTSRSGPVLAGAVGAYVVLAIVLLLIFTGLLYPIATLLGGIGLARFARGVLPSQAVAVSTRSSLATLPALMEGAEKLFLPKEMSAFVLTLAVSIFKVNMAITVVLKLYLLSRVYQIEFGLDYLAFFVAAVFLFSMGAPGIPSGSFLTTLPLFLAVGIPIEGLILMKAVDAIPDIFKTLANVTADMTAATVVTRLLAYSPSPEQTSVEAASLD
jgi:Na+/H+-dicarboxylate symporter